MKYKTAIETRNFTVSSQNYSLISVSENQYIGYDQDGFLCIIIVPKSIGTSSYSTISNNIKLEFNELIRFNLDEGNLISKVHIITCLSKDKDLIGVFLDLCELYLKDVPSTSHEISKIFNMLNDFFKVDMMFSINEIRGLLCELLFIDYVNEKLFINISQYWHSHSEMKFDFSISKKMKIEVKSTTTQERLHYFSHEQLSTALYEIYVASYLVRADDSGENLIELIDRLMNKFDFEGDSYKYVLNVKAKLLLSKVPLEKFDIDYTKNSLRIYDAKDIPKVEGGPFTGVTDIKYKSYLSDNTSLSNKSFVDNLIPSLEDSLREIDQS